jgi:hypothetical protein
VSIAGIKVEPAAVSVGENIVISWAVKNARPANVKIVYDDGDPVEIPVPALTGQTPYTPTRSGQVTITVTGTDAAGKPTKVTRSVAVKVNP